MSNFETKLYFSGWHWFNFNWLASQNSASCLPMAIKDGKNVLVMKISTCPGLTLETCWSNIAVIVPIIKAMFWYSFGSSDVNFYLALGWISFDGWLCEESRETSQKWKTAGISPVLLVVNPTRCGPPDWRGTCQRWLWKGKILSMQDDHTSLVCCIISSFKDNQDVFDIFYNNKMVSNFA